jgi:hypothetical protein
MVLNVMLHDRPMDEELMSDARFFFCCMLGSIFCACSYKARARMRRGAAFTCTRSSSAFRLLASHDGSLAELFAFFN